MHARRMLERVRNHDWFGVAIEFVVVVLGILIAFQVTEWNEDRQERAREKQYLARIAAEFDANVAEIERAIKLKQERAALIDLLVRAAQDPAPVTADPSRFVYAVEVGGYTFAPSIGSQTFDEIKAAGDLRVLRDEQLRIDLMRFYTQIKGESQWNYLRELRQAEYIKRATGILSYEQVRRLLKNYPEVPDATVDEAMAVRARMLKRTEFLEWLAEANDSEDDIYEYGKWLKAAQQLRARLPASP